MTRQRLVRLRSARTRLLTTITKVSDMLVNSRRMILNVGDKKIKLAVGNDMTEDKMNRILIVG